MIIEKTELDSQVSKLKLLKQSHLSQIYELEDKVSIYPRIVIDKKVIQLISPQDKSYIFIRYDNDGLAFLNFLNIVILSEKG